MTFVGVRSMPDDVVTLTLTRDELATVIYLCGLAPDVPEVEELRHNVLNVIWYSNNEVPNE